MRVWPLILATRWVVLNRPASVAHVTARCTVLRFTWNSSARNVLDDREKGEIIVVVITDMGDPFSAAVMVNADQMWRKQFAPPFTLKKVAALDSATLTMWHADRGRRYTATFDSHPTSDECITCPALTLIAQHRQIVSVTILISTGETIPAAHVRAFVRYTGEVVAHPTGVLPVPEGFTALPS